MFVCVHDIRRAPLGQHVDNPQPTCPACPLGWGDHANLQLQIRSAGQGPGVRWNILGFKLARVSVLSIILAPPLPLSKQVELPWP